MTTTRLSSAQRRAAIIESAISLFAERGFRGTTTRELAAHVGVSEPVLYQHFNTKRDLYHAILEQLATADDQGIPKLLPDAADTRDDRLILTELAKNIVDWHVNHPNYVRLLMIGALEGNEFNEIFHERYARSFTDQLQKYFAVRIKLGIFRLLDPAMAARTFMWMLAHYSLELTLFHKGPCGNPLPQAQAVDGIIDIYLKGIQA